MIMQSIRQVARLNEAELEKVVPPNASWHTDYRDTAYIYIGGIPLQLSEGDVLLIFSQYGEPVDVKLARDKDSGKSRGFGWLKYADQRSCDMAVDNLSGASVLGRVLSVDHTRYKKREGEVETVGEEEVVVEGRRKRQRTESESESEEERPRLKEEEELAELMREHDDDDPMKAYLVKQKKEEIAEALKSAVVEKAGREKERNHKHKHKHRHRPSRRGEEDEDDRDGGRRRNGHRSRRDRSEDEDVDEADSKRRSHHRRERSASPGSEEDHDSRRRRSRRARSDSDEERKRRSSSGRSDS